MLCAGLPWWPTPQTAVPLNQNGSQKERHACNAWRECKELGCMPRTALKTRRSASAMAEFMVVLHEAEDVVEEAAAVLGFRKLFERFHVSVALVIEDLGEVVVFSRCKWTRRSYEHTISIFQKAGGYMHLKRSARIFLLIFAVFVTMAGPSLACAQKLQGTTGKSAQWGSGWLDLASPLSISKGQHLVLSIGGTATKIIVRLLPEGASADTTVGVIPEPVAVPKSRIVDIVVPDDRKQVIQISVHGGPNPWGQFPLGEGNGPATIQSAELKK